MSENVTLPARSRSTSIVAENNQDSNHLNRKMERVNKVWQCEKCSMINQLRTKKCSICSAPQPISLSGQESINPSPFLEKAESSPQQPAETEIKPESLYYESNSNLAAEVNVNDTLEGGASSSSNQNSDSNNSQHQKTADDHWTCPTCTYSNSMKDKLCDICGFKLRAIRAANKPKHASTTATSSNGHRKSSHQEQRDTSHRLDHNYDDDEAYRGHISMLSTSSQDQRKASAAVEMEEGEESIDFGPNKNNNHDLNEEISDASSYDSNSEDDNDHQHVNKHNKDENNDEDEDDHTAQHDHDDDMDEDENTALPQQSSSDHEPQSDTWKCPHCTLINAVGFKFCDLCGCPSPVKGKLYRDKAIRTQIRLQKSDRRKAAAASKAAKKALRETNNKSKVTVVKREKIVLEEQEEDDISSTVMINDNESLVSQSNDNQDNPNITSSSGIKRRRVAADNDYVSLSRKRQRKKSYLRRVSQEDDGSVNGGNDKEQLQASEHRPKKQATAAIEASTISKEERAQELKNIYEQQFDTPPAMKRGMAIIWHCSECGVVNRLKDETCAKCNHIQVAPYRYCALCTYFKAVEHRKAKRLAAEEAGEHPFTSAKDGKGTTAPSSSSQSRRGMLSAEFRRAAAEAAVQPQYNRQPKVGPEYQLDPHSLPQPCRFIRTALDYSLYHDRLLQEDIVDEISPWEYTNGFYEVLWMPPRDDVEHHPRDFDAFLPKHHISDTTDAASEEVRDESQIAEVVMDVVDTAVNLAVDGEIALLFKRHPVLSMQCLLQCNYNLVLVTELLPAMIAKYGNNGLDSHVISMDEEQFNVFEEAMIVHGDENWTAVKNELKQQFSVAELQDFYLIVWSQRYKERSLEAGRQHRIYNRMSAASRQRRLKNKHRSDSELNREDEQANKNSSDDRSEEPADNHNINHQERDEDDDKQELVHIDGSDMVSYYQVHSTAEQLSVVTCSIPPVHQLSQDDKDEEEEVMIMMDDNSHVEMKSSDDSAENSDNDDDDNNNDSTMDIEIAMVSSKVVTFSSHMDTSS